MSKKLIYGVGVNDADYNVTRSEYTGITLPSGRKQTKIVWRCPFYQKWDNMLARGYSHKYHEKHPTYKDCIVYEEWLTFSNFRKWMLTQDWEDKHLDKDYLFESNKVYSPDTCIFVVQLVNNFIEDRGATRGKYLLGACLPKGRSELANSEYVTDDRVGQFLLHRYENYSIVEDHIK